MSNEMTVINSAHTRTSKAGKVSYRGTLGVIMSGNAAERREEATSVAHTLASNNTFTPIMNELARVFPCSVLKKHGVSVVGENYALIEAKTITWVPMTGDVWGMVAADLYCGAIVARCEALEEEGKELKGEKLTAWEMAVIVQQAVEAKRLAKLAAPVTAAA